MALFSMVNEVAAQLKNLDPEKAVLALAENNLSANPEGCKRLAEEYKKKYEQESSEADSAESKATPENAAKANAAFQFTYLQTIPGLLERIMDVIEKRQAEPAVRAAFLGTLIYFVKPKDVMPDNMPGGVGFLDDGLIIYSIAEEFLSVLKPKNMNSQNIKAACYFFSFGIPQNLKPIVESQIEQMWKSFHLLKTTPGVMVEMILQQLLTNPYALQSILAEEVYQNTNVPQMPSGMMSPQFPSGGMYSPYPAGTTFSTTPGGGSVFTEGGNMSVSFGGGGGASMVDGNIVCWD